MWFKPYQVSRDNIQERKSPSKNDLFWIVTEPLFEDHIMLVESTESSTIALCPTLDILDQVQCRG